MGVFIGYVLTYSLELVALHLMAGSRPESTDQPPATTDLLPAVIVLGVALVICVVLLATAIFTIVLLYTSELCTNIFECDSHNSFYFSQNTKHTDSGCNLLCVICIGNQKLSSTLKNMRSPNSHYDEVEMGLHSLLKSNSKSTTEPQYETCEGGVTSSDVAMEENPAYQSVDVTATKP